MPRKPSFLSPWSSRFPSLGPSGCQGTSWTHGPRQRGAGQVQEAVPHYWSLLSGVTRTQQSRQPLKFVTPNYRSHPYTPIQVYLHRLLWMKVKYTKFTSFSHKVLQRLLIKMQGMLQENHYCKHIHVIHINLRKKESRPVVNPHSPAISQGLLMRGRGTELNLFKYGCISQAINPGLALRVHQTFSRVAVA